MKKNYLFILFVFALMACNDDCDHTTNSGSTTSFDYYEYFANGSWYEESENEEIRYTVSGTYYDIYCKPTIANETNGRYEIDAVNKKMTTTYTFMGQTQFSDWKIKETESFRFTITSDKVGIHTFEKIVEIYSMNVGETRMIQFKDNSPTYTIKGYLSKNESIVSVSSDGTITAEGEKGSTYIKILTDMGNVWVKVVVGEERADLWYDYSILIGKDYNEMVAIMGGNPSYSAAEGYEYTMSLHNTVSCVDIFMNESGKVDEVALVLKEGSQESVKAYIISKYYEFGEELDNYYLYQTGPTLDESKAVVAYAKDGSKILFGAPEYWKVPTYVDLWPDYTDGFGKTAEELIKKYGDPMFEVEPYLFWSLKENDYVVTMAFYMDDKTSKATAYRISLNEVVPQEEIIDYLGKKFYFVRETEGYYIYSDVKDVNKATMQITYNTNSGIVTYYDLATFGK